MSAISPKADIRVTHRHVRHGPIADIAVRDYVAALFAAMNSTDTPHHQRRSRKEAACEGNGAALRDDAPDAAE